MPKMIFLNLPVKDLAAATRFYEAIGCKKNEQFSDEKESSMVWSDTITFQLLTRAYFATFAPKPIADARESCGALIALARDSREEVDTITKAAAAAGGRADVRAKVRNRRAAIHPPDSLSISYAAAPFIHCGVAVRNSDGPASREAVSR